MMDNDVKIVPDTAGWDGFPQAVTALAVAC
jgi:hypothetical protein